MSHYNIDWHWVIDDSVYGVEYTVPDPANQSQCIPNNQSDAILAPTFQTAVEYVESEFYTIPFSVHCSERLGMAGLHIH